MDKKITGLLLIFLLSFGIFTTIVVFNKPLTQFTRASEENNPSPNNSLIFAWPLTTAADGKTAANVNVFVRSYKATPLSNRVVKLSTSLGNIKEINNTTDKTGKATFEIVSGEKGIAEVEATIDTNVKIVQKVSIKFE